jgi:transcriptional regulator with XRE-family HTH domain
MKKAKMNRYKTLEELIRANGYSIDNFCKECNLSKSYFYYVRKGIKTPSVDVAMTICRVLKISLKDLLIYIGKDVTGIPNDE